MKRLTTTRTAMLSGGSAWLVAVLADAAIVLAQQAPRKKPLIDRLDDPTRAKVLAALAALLLLGFLMLALVWMGARYTRRYMSSSSRYVPPKRTSFDVDDWAKKPLNHVEGQDDD